MRPLSSSSRSLMEGSWVTRAPSTPSGGLRTGKGQRKSRVRPKPPFLSPASPGSAPEVPRHSRAAPGSGAESSGSGEDGAGQVLAGRGWAKQLRQLCPPKSGPQPRGRGAVCPPRTATPGASPRDASTGPPGCAARQGLPKERADPELLQRPGAAEREEKEPERPLLPSLRAEAGAGTALPCGDGHGGGTEPRGAGQRRCPALPGTRHRDSPESDDARAAGPDEDEGLGGLAFLLASGVAGRPLPAGQHLQLAQGQAELRARGAATSAERSGRERAGGGRARWLPSGVPLTWARPWAPPAPGCRGPGAAPWASLPRGRGRGQGQGEKGSRGLPLLLGLGDDQGVTEEEEVPLPRPTALGHPHALAEQRLWRRGDGRALLRGVGVVPAEQTAPGVRKAAAAGPGCAGASPSHGGSLPGPAAAVRLAHPAEVRRSLASDAAVGLGRVPSRPERGCRGGRECWEALLGGSLALPSAALSWHSAEPVPAGSVVAAGGSAGSTRHGIVTSTVAPGGALGALPTMATSLWYWGAQAWAQPCRHGLTSAEQRARVTSRQLPARLCPVQPRVPLAAGFGPGHLAGSSPTWCPPGPPGPFLPRCFPAACQGAFGHE